MDKTRTTDGLFVNTGIHSCGGILQAPFGSDWNLLSSTRKYCISVGSLFLNHPIDGNVAKTVSSSNKKQQNYKDFLPQFEICKFVNSDFEYTLL